MYVSHITVWRNFSASIDLIRIEMSTAVRRLLVVAVSGSETLQGGPNRGRHCDVTVRFSAAAQVRARTTQETRFYRYRFVERYPNKCFIQQRRVLS